MDSTPRTAESWHAWFTHQATWTQDTRQWLYTQVGLPTARSVLEVGCGTGVIAGEIARQGPAVVGLDIDAAMLAVARREAPAGRYVQGDALALPFPDDTFDVALCHYLLLWLADPIQGLREMARVVRPGGVVLACAEPDYGGRIDHPPELAPLGQLQAESLRRQGADPSIGRKLGELLAAAGLETTVGTMAGQWARPSPESLAAEWAMRRHDLAGMLSESELDRLEGLDREAAESGRRVLFVPTFYAWGRKGLPGERVSARPDSARAPDEDRPGAHADGADVPAANLRPALPAERDDYTWTVMNILSDGDLSMAAVMRSRFLTWWARRVLHFYFHRFCRPLVLEVEGTPAGFLVLKVQKDALRVEAVGVLPAYRQQGWGMWLLEWAAQEAGRLGLARLELHVSSGNRPALALYAKAGFHPVPRAWRGFQMERVLEKKE